MLPETKELPVVKEIFEDIKKTIREEFPKYVESVPPAYISKEEFFRRLKVPEKAVLRTDSWIQRRVTAEERRAKEYGIEFKKEDIQKIELTSLPKVAIDSFNWAISITQLLGAKYKPEIYRFLDEKYREYEEKLKKAIPV